MRNALVWEIENAIKYMRIEKPCITVDLSETSGNRPQALALWYQKVIDELERLSGCPDEWPAITVHLDECRREDFLTAIQNLIAEHRDSQTYVADESNWQYVGCVR